MRFAPLFNLYTFIILFSLGWISIGLLNVVLASASQQVIPRDKLARVDSIKYSMGVLTMPVGSLIGGVLVKFVAVKASSVLASIFFTYFIIMVHK